jgi:hypothetical protein
MRNRGDRTQLLSREQAGALRCGLLATLLAFRFQIEVGFCNQRLHYLSTHFAGEGLLRRAVPVIIDAKQHY